MERRIPLGIIVFRILYAALALILLPHAAKSFWAFSIALVNLLRFGGGEDPTHLMLYYFTLIGVVIYVIPFVIFLIITIGLFRLLNNLRLFMLITNLLFIAVLLDFMYVMADPESLLNTIFFQKRLIIISLVIFALSIYYFTRPKVKEEFA